MEKAYDVKDLLAKYKARGLDVGEDAAKGLLEDTFAWLDESAKLSPMPYDDMAAVAVYPKLKEFALGAADKIDGKEG